MAQILAPQKKESLVRRFLFCRKSLKQVGAGTKCLGSICPMVHTMRSSFRNVRRCEPRISSRAVSPAIAAALRQERACVEPKWLLGEGHLEVGPGRLEAGSTQLG